MKKKKEAVISEAEVELFKTIVSPLIKEATGNTPTKRYAKDLILKLITTVEETRIALELIADREHGLRKNLILVMCERSEGNAEQILQAHTIVTGEETLTSAEHENAISILAYGAAQLRGYDAKQLLANLADCSLVAKIVQLRKQISQDLERTGRAAANNHASVG